MMDLATMQTKVDEGVYRTMDSLEVSHITSSSYNTTISLYTHVAGGFTEIGDCCADVQFAWNDTPQFSRSSIAVWSQNHRT